MLREMGAVVLDADVIVRDLQRRDAEGYLAIVETFGSRILDERGDIDRAKLGAEVFTDPAKLASLERLMHPLVVGRITQQHQALSHAEVMVVEAIKLLESKMRRMYDEIWVVLAEEEVIVERLRGRGLSERESQLRRSRQATDTEFRAAADVVIENGTELARTREKIALELSRVRAIVSAR